MVVVSGLQQKDRWAPVDIWYLPATPLPGGARNDALACQGKVGGDADLRFRGAGIDQGFEHLPVPVGRFNKNLRSFFATRILLEFFDPLFSRLIFRRQVTVESEVLAG